MYSKLLSILSNLLPSYLQENTSIYTNFANLRLFFIIFLPFLGFHVEKKRSCFQICRHADILVLLLCMQWSGSKWTIEFLKAKSKALLARYPKRHWKLVPPFFIWLQNNFCIWEVRWHAEVITDGKWTLSTNKVISWHNMNFLYPVFDDSYVQQKPHWNQWIFCLCRVSCLQHWGHSDYSLSLSRQEVLFHSCMSHNSSISYGKVNQ